MSSGLRGDINHLFEMERRIRRLPRVVGAKLAAAAASKITELGQRTFTASENAYGDSWDTGASGELVHLRRSGRLARNIRYAATGTRLRAVLATPYAKYQVGRRPVFPRFGARLPVAYVLALTALSDEIVKAELGGGA